MGCGRRAHPNELSRVAKRPDGTVVVGREQPGRGAWLCRASRGCLEGARSREALERSLRTCIPPRAFEELRAKLMTSEDAPAGN